jgi:hypothetical protein
MAAPPCFLYLLNCMTNVFKTLLKKGNNRYNIFTELMDFQNDHWSFS